MLADSIITLFNIYTKGYVLVIDETPSNIEGVEGRFIINLPKRYYRIEYNSIYTLCHELVHLWQALNGKRLIHNKLFYLKLIQLIKYLEKLSNGIIIKYNDNDIIDDIVDNADNADNIINYISNMNIKPKNIF